MIGHDYIILKSLWYMPQVISIIIVTIAICDYVLCEYNHIYHIHEGHPMIKI